MCALAPPSSVMRRARRPIAWFPLGGTRWPKVLLIVALLLVYGAGFQALGFIPCTLALLLVLMWFIDPVDGGWRSS